MDHANARGALHAAGRGAADRGVHTEAVARRHPSRLRQLQDRALSSNQVGTVMYCEYMHSGYKWDFKK